MSTLDPMRIALASCLDLPEPDPDQAPTLEALTRAGHEAIPVAWDDPKADWGSFDLCVLRATWNYARHVEAFIAWLDRVSTQTRLWNSAGVAKANLHKRYLLDLEARGIPIVPTTIVLQGQACDVQALVDQRGWAEVVVKPAIGAGSWRTMRFESDAFAEAGAFVREIGAHGDVLVQEARPEFADPGERALVWIDGELTHSVVKRPRYAGQDESVSPGGPVTDAQRDFADEVLKLVREPLMYARIDVIPTREGFMLNELELIEPSLFFNQGPVGLARFVEAVGRLV